MRGLKDGTFVNTVNILDKILIVCKAGGGAYIRLLKSSVRAGSKRIKDGHRSRFLLSIDGVLSAVLIRKFFIRFMD